MTQVIGTSPLNQFATPTQGFSVVAAKPKRQGSAAGRLNLVSLMDIFTILVFFLMLNSGDVEVLQPDDAIALPQSSATLKPADVPVIKITAGEILFRDQAVASLNGLADGDSIPALEDALNNYAIESPLVASEEGNAVRGVSIMSDAGISYALLKRVLYASAQAGFRDIGLATEFAQEK